MEQETDSLVEQLQKSIQTFESLSINAECRDKLWRYNDALMQSLRSIIEDPCDVEAKMQYMNTSFEQYVSAMKELLPQLINYKITPEESQPCPVGKSDPNRFDIIHEIKKYNPYHGKDGRFASKNGGAGTGGVAAAGTAGGEFGNSDIKTFAGAVENARESCNEDIRWRVTAHTEQELKNEYPGAKLHVTKGGSTVAVATDGDIISVCKKAGDNTRGKDLMKLAVENGGTKLDSFDGNHNFYTKCGFEPVSWTPFNKEYAPPGWKEGQHQPESVIFYKYTGKQCKVTKEEFLSKTKPFEGEDGYYNAMVARDKSVGGKK